MNQVLADLLERYDCRNIADVRTALREILQEVSLLGLWRGQFFQKAAFYGGTALRILYGLDRYSEDLDFSLLKPMPDFDLSTYMNALEREVQSFGFEVRVEKKRENFPKSGPIGFS